MSAKNLGDASRTDFNLLLRQNTEKHFLYDETQTLLQEALEKLKSLGFKIYDKTLESTLEGTTATLIIEWKVYDKDFAVLPLLYIGKKQVREETAFTDPTNPDVGAIIVLETFKVLGCKITYETGNFNSISFPVAIITLYEDKKNDLEATLHIDLQELE